MEFLPLSAPGKHRDMWLFSAGGVQVCLCVCVCVESELCVYRNLKYYAKKNAHKNITEMIKK